VSSGYCNRFGDEEGSTMSPRVDVTALTAVTLAGQR
jgi:hypothetical protein